MKTLITKQNIESRISPMDHKFYADGSIILTAGAKDELRSRGIRIVYGPMPEQPSACCKSSSSISMEDAVKSITVLLKTRFGIDDPETVRCLIGNAVKALKNA